MACSIRPMPIRFGGVPIGVKSPPRDAAYAIISISAEAKRRGGAAPRAGSMAASTDCAIGSIIAVVAVFEIQAETNAVVRPSPTKARSGSLFTAPRPSTR